MNKTQNHISFESNLREISKKNRRFVLLDTNFMLSCIKDRIDFFEEIRLMGMQILIPKQVINELEKISNSKKKFHFREDAKLVLRLLEKSKFKRINLDKKNVDAGISDFANKNKNIIVATQDRELKRMIKGNKMIIRQKKKLEIV